MVLVLQVVTYWSGLKEFTPSLLVPKYPFPASFMVCQRKFIIKVIANTKQKHAHHWQISQSGCLAKTNFNQKKECQHTMAAKINQFIDRLLCISKRQLCKSL